MKKRNIFIIAGVALMVVGVFCAVRGFLTTYAPEAVLSETVDFSTPAPEHVMTLAPAETAEADGPTPEPTATPYVSPIDFDELKSVNSDIYAWLEIDGTDISYPVVQSPDDNSYYLNHNSDRNYSANGAIFSEDYNTPDLSDPVTVLYGHHMTSGAMFGNLQKDFSDAAFFEENDIIRVYTPDALLEYGVFAAVPYSSEHLLYTYDFSDEAVFSAFFQGVMNIRSLECRFREEYAPEPGDRVLILSTCLVGNNSRRFLVMATLRQ